jgi:hypothetical protein
MNADMLWTIARDAAIVALCTPWVVMALMLLVGVVDLIKDLTNGNS